MFVDSRRVVERRFVDVIPAFTSTAGPWLPEVVQRSVEKTDKLTTRFGAGPLSKRVSVKMGRARQTGRRFVVPIRIMATGPEGLFPHLDANVEVRALSSGDVEIRLVGTYRPPLGHAGEVLDKMILHRLAEATLDNFMDEMVARFEHPTFLASLA